MVALLKKYLSYFGPLIFMILLLAPTGLEANQQRFLAIFGFVIFNWLFTAIPLAISGLLGLCLTVLFGITTAKSALAPLADPIIYLFFGGFLFARAMNKVGLDTRISLNILASNLVKGSFHKMVFAILAITAFFSMWVSNTATTAMMLPIVLGTLENLKIKDQKLTALLLLAMAYAASVGGLGTPVGSPPNLIAIGLLKSITQVNVSFLQWLLLAAPLVVCLVLIIFFYIKKFIPTEITSFNNDFIQDELKLLPPTSKAEITIVILFCLTVGFWFAPSILKLFLDDSSIIAQFATSKLDAGIVAIFFSSLLFLFPLKGKGENILVQEDLKRIDWNSLILFGTGISLGQTLFDTGLAKLVGDAILYNVAGGHIFILFLVVAYFTLFSTELASNTATANIVLPILIAMAMEMKISPTLLTMASALACSLAFMLPVATPPNAIVYGTGKVELKDMVKFGLGLNLIAGLILTIYFYVLSFFMN